MWTEVLDATYLDGYRILVKFNDGIKKVVDLANVIKQYPVFKPLKDLTLFKQFTVTDTFEWHNGKMHIAPEYLYDKGVAA